MNPKRILITGASSGIGAALAKAYAAPGVTLFLSGQNQERIEKVQRGLGDSGAVVLFKRIDVADPEAMQAWVRSCCTSGPLDLVIANAGISGDARAGIFPDGAAGDTANGAADGAADGAAEGAANGADDSAAEGGNATGAYRRQLDRVFAVNVTGVFNTVLAAVDPMKQQGCGQIAVVSSLAGFRGMPGAAAYCASKAAVRSWVEALRPELARAGLKLNLVCPGFVRSRITDENAFPMPFFMEGEQAAARIKSGLEKNRGRIAFPLPMYAGAVLLNALPNRLAEFLTGLTGAKYNKQSAHKPRE